MSQVATQKPAPGAVSVAKTTIGTDSWRRLLKRAEDGDKGCLPEVRALLAHPDDGPICQESFGSSAEWLRQSIVRKAAGTNVLAQEAIRAELDSKQSQFEGPNPTPLERLLAERASFCWFIVHWYETAYANADGWSIAQAGLQHRKIDKAHARFLSAVRTLAQVRKLALPTLQVNIARNQVNVAEAGP